MDVSRRFRAALPSPRIPLALDGGLGYDDLARTPDANIVVQVGPWSDFQDGDTLQILWGTAETVVATRPSSEADANTVVDVFVPARSIENAGDGTHDVRARVTNVLGVPVTSLSMPVLVKLSVPGGHDPDAHTPYANENLASPQVEPATIQPVTPGAIVRIVAYENMAAGDVITVRWNVEGNDILYGPVTQTEADGLVTLSVDIDRAAIDAGGVGEEVKVTYQIYDVVHNWSLWSPYTRGDVTDPNAPPAPWVEGTVNDAGQVLDVDILAGAPVSVLVEGSGAVVGDSVTVHWAGATAAGQPVTYDTPAQSPARPGQTLTFSVHNDKVKPLAQGSARAWYTIASVAGGTVRTSARRNLSIIGQVMPLIRPSVAEANGNTLDPGDLTGGFAHATVPAWSGMQVGDVVTLVGEGRRSNGDPTTWSDSHEVSSAMLHRDVAFDIPANVITPLVDGSLRLYYLIAPFGTARQGRTQRRLALAALRSENLDLDIRLAATDLPVPGVDEASGTTLDPVLAIHGITVRIPATDAITSGDLTAVTITDTPNGSETTPPQVGSPAGMTFVLRPALIAQNLGKDIAIHYTVTPTAGGASRTSPVLSLHVLDFVDNDPAIGKPLIAEAIAFVLDLGTLEGNATVSVPAWPLMATGQRFWLRASSGTDVLVLANGESVSVVGAITKALPRTWLDTLVDNARIVLELRIAFGGGNEATAKVVASAPYVVRAVGTPPNEWDLEYDFDEDALREVAPGLPIYFPDQRGVMNFEFDRAADPPVSERMGVEVYPFGSTADFSGNCVFIGHPEGISHHNVIFFNFDETWDVVRFALTSADREVTVTFKDSNLNVISGLITIPEGSVERQIEVAYDDGGRGRIRHVELLASDVIRLDSFKFRK